MPRLLGVLTMMVMLWGCSGNLQEVLKAAEKGVAAAKAACEEARTYPEGSDKDKAMKACAYVLQAEVMVKGAAAEVKPVEKP